MSFSKLSVLLLATFSLAACAPSADKLTKLVEEHPEIVFNAIEKNPEKFFNAFQKARQVMESQAQAEELKGEVERAKKDMENPKDKPDMSSDRAAKGPADAPITIVAYSDFQCPYCVRGHQTIEKVFEAFPGKIRYIHKHLPLPMHPLAPPAAKRYEAIAMQSSELAVKYHDEVFANLDALNAGGEKFLDEAAAKIGADVKKMKADMNGAVVKKRLAADEAEARKYGFQGTPGYYMEGAKISGAYPFEFFKGLIEHKLAK